VPNQYYDNDLEAQRFQPGTTVSADAVDSKLDEIASGFEAVEVDTNRSLKFPAEPGTSQEFTATPLERRRKVLGFDENGTLALLAGFGWRGDWAATTDYFLNDVLRDPTSKNLYVATLGHTSGATFTTTNLDLAINVADVEAAKQAAEAARDKAGKWASSLTVVESGIRGAAFYALDAQASEQSARGSSLAVAAAESRVLQLEQSATSAETTAIQSANSAGDSAQAAATSENNIQGVEQQVNDTAVQVDADAQTATGAADDAALVAQSINDTTTMDFLNFELNGPDLIAHFAGYSDANNFIVNAAGELEVTL
jgi:hypothetical protein